MPAASAASVLGPPQDNVSPGPETRDEHRGDAVRVGDGVADREHGRPSEGSAAETERRDHTRPPDDDRRARTMEPERREHGRTPEGGVAETERRDHARPPEDDRRRREKRGASDRDRSLEEARQIMTNWGGRPKAPTDREGHSRERRFSPEALDTASGPREARYRGGPVSPSELGGASERQTATAYSRERQAAEARRPGGRAATDDPWQGPKGDPWGGRGPADQRRQGHRRVRHEEEREPHEMRRSPRSQRGDLGAPCESLRRAHEMLAGSPSWMSRTTTRKIYGQTSDRELAEPPGETEKPRNMLDETVTAGRCSIRIITDAHVPAMTSREIEMRPDEGRTGGAQDHLLGTVETLVGQMRGTIEALEETAMMTITCMTGTQKLKRRLIGDVARGPSIAEWVNGRKPHATIGETTIIQIITTTMTGTDSIGMVVGTDVGQIDTTTRNA